MIEKKFFINEDKKDRFTIKPILNKDLWDILKKEAYAATWFADEISLADDLKDWDSLDDGERKFLKYVLAFFAGSDTLVSNNINNNFIQDVNIMEAQWFYAHQAFIENVHAETYANLIESYIKDETEREYLFKSLETIPVVKKKGQWANKYSNPENATFQERLVAFCIFEGVFFSGSFAAIFYMKKRGLLPGLCQSNSYISRDEGLHCKFACKLYSKLIEKLDQETIEVMFRSAVEIEIEFINEALSCDLIGMNKTLMGSYIKYVADFWITELGYKPIYNVGNPFDFMNLISMQSKTNFFEQRATEYSLSNVGNDAVNNVYGYDDDF